MDTTYKQALKQYNKETAAILAEDPNLEMSYYAQSYSSLRDAFLENYPQANLPNHSLEGESIKKLSFTIFILLAKIFSNFFGWIKNIILLFVQRILKNINYASRSVINSFSIKEMKATKTLEGFSFTKEKVLTYAKNSSIVEQLNELRERVRILEDKIDIDNIKDNSL